MRATVGRRRAVWALGWMLGCGPRIGSTDATGSAEGGNTTNSGGSEGSGVLDGSIPSPTVASMGSDGSGALDDTTTTTETADATTTADTTGDPPGATCPQPGEQQCDPLSQDCPAGSRCRPWNGLSAFGSTVCVPDAPAPVARYGACTSDPMTCSDDCEIGTWCAADSTYFVHDDVCLGICSGDSDCEPNESCVLELNNLLGACLPACDPLDPVCPAQTSPCVSYPHQPFVCSPGVATAGTIGQPCMGSPCPEGSACIDGFLLGDACDGGACCTELCDLDGNPACTEPGTVCTPASDVFPLTPAQDHVGYCGPA